MAVVAWTANSKIQDLKSKSSMLAKHNVLYLNRNLCNDSPFSRRGFAEFQKQPDLQTSSSGPLICEDDLQQEYATATGQELEEAIFLESALQFSNGVSAGAGEISRTMQERVGPYASSRQNQPIYPDSIERDLSGEFGSFAFNELLDIWGDTRFSSHETATAALFPKERLEWNGASTSCMSGDTVTATALVGFERPPGGGSCSSSISPWAETSSEENDLECPQLQPAAEDIKPRPVGAGVQSGSSLMYHHVPTLRVPTSEDVALHLSSSWQREIPERPLSPSLQSLSRPKARFHPQSLERSRVQDAAVVEQFTDSVVDSMDSGNRRHEVFQQTQPIWMSTSPDIVRRRQAGQCHAGGKASYFTSEDLSPLKLKERLDAPAVERPAARKYQRRAVNGINMDGNGFATPLDHVQRERQRRDLMASRIAALELMLPKSAKRDRVSVVYDAIHFLKRLERRVMILQQRLRDLKERRRSELSARCKQSIPKSIEGKMGTLGSYFSNEVVIKGVGKYIKPVVICTRPTWGKRENRPTQKSSTITSGHYLEGNILDRGSVLVEFNVQMNNTVTIQEERLKCPCRMDYLPVMMGVVEEFRLEVISCNIMKLCGYFTCTLGLKTRRGEKTTAAQFADRLQSVVDIDTAGEGVTKQFLGLESPKAYI